MVNPRATNEDLTAKARIRNAALDLYAEHGEDRVSLRAIAAEAGVTLGLVQHHFKTKAGLHEAVDKLVTDYCWRALDEAPTEGTPLEVAKGRTRAVLRMVAENPPVASYIRRQALELGDNRASLVDMFVDNALQEVAALRKAGVASTEHRESTQVITILMRHMGALFLQPLLEKAWERIPHNDDDPKPRVSVTVKDS